MFCNPTRDIVAKYLLDDEQIRNSFIRALTPFDDVTSSKKLDNALRPLKLDQNLLNILKDDSFVQFLKNESHHLPKGTKDEKLTHRFFAHLRDNYEEIRNALVDDKGPVSDVICKLSTGDYVLVEVQIERQDFWNKRALAYASMLFGNQLRKGEEWRDLKDVVAVNILGTGQNHDRPFWTQGSTYKRHFIFQDQLDTSKKPMQLDHIQLLQYSLGNVDLEKVDNLEERAWLDFFKNAHHYQDIPKNSPEIMKLAYERIVEENLPANIKELYVGEEQSLKNFRQRFQEERIKEKQEIAEKCRKKGMVTQEISDLTGLSQEELIDLFKSK